MNPEEKGDSQEAPAPVPSMDQEAVEPEDLEPDMPLDAYGCFYRDNLETYLTNNPGKSAYGMRG